MAVKNLYILVAREVSTDSADNLTSIHKIIDKFTFSLNYAQLAKDGVRVGFREIGVPVNYAVATSWMFSEKLKKDEFYTFRLNFYDPTGKKISGGPEQENLLPAGTDKFNMNFNIQGMAITRQGAYRLEAEVLSKDNKHLAKAEYPFQVVFDAPAA